MVGMLERGDLDAVLSPDPQVARLLETGKFQSIANVGRGQHVLRTERSSGEV
ncbi:MAG: hypothetical protein HYY46_25980 [Deltaproteobacteria bacterium]|nr:hypothetical protein [Deltaproteobacteria bacterium]